MKPMPVASSADNRYSIASEPITQDMIQIADGRGFRRNSTDAPIRPIRQEAVDNSTLHYLAKLTMSIAGKQPNLGAPNFLLSESPDGGGTTIERSDRCARTYSTVLLSRGVEADLA